MCSGALSLQSQHDFRIFGESQKGSKMESEMEQFEVQNRHYTALGGPWSDFGSHFCSSEMMRTKVTKTHRVGAPFGAARRNEQRRWGVGGAEFNSTV